MEKQINTSCRTIIVVILLVVGMCISLAGCTVTEDVSVPADEFSTTEISTSANDKFMSEEPNSVPIPNNSDPAPPKKETTTPEASHIHSYSGKVMAPTCTTEGYTVFSCDCGITYTSDYTNAVGHNYSVKTTAATCAENGYTTYACSFCGVSYDGNTTNSIGHSWSEWTVTKEPSTIAEGEERRICKACGKTDSRCIEKLAYEKFDGPVDVYNAYNLAYTDWKGDTEQAAYIEVYTAKESDTALTDLVVEFEKIYGFTPSLEDKYCCTTSCTEVGIYAVDSYTKPQTIYHYTITDKTYIYITNNMYEVYVQQCDDGSVWVGYCVYGTLDSLWAEREKAEVQALDSEMYATFEELIGLSRSEMNAYKDDLDLKIGYISQAGTVRSVHSDAPVQVLYIYCRGFVYGDNNA